MPPYIDELAGAIIENVIDIKKYSSTRKLYRITTSWVNRFANDLKEKLLNNAILLKTFVTVQKLKRAQFQWIKVAPPRVEKTEVFRKD